MGSNLHLTNEVPAGNIVGIGGLEDDVIKIATISSSQACPNFAKTKAISLGLIKVAIESKSLSGMEILKNGLERLNRSDPSVQFYINNQGEYILSTCGEVHLERCIKDLKDDFAQGVEVHVSDPIVTFKETIVNSRLSLQKKKQKEQYEEAESSSDDGEENKDENEKTLDDYMNEYEKIQQQVQKVREFLRKEMKPDMYIEKILQNKYYKDMNALKAVGYEPACAEDNTAN